MLAIQCRDRVTRAKADKIREAAVVEREKVDIIRAEHADAAYRAREKQKQRECARSSLTPSPSPTPCPRYAPVTATPPWACHAPLTLPDRPGARYALELQEARRIQQVRSTLEPFLMSKAERQMNAAMLRKLPP